MPEYFEHEFEGLFEHENGDILHVYSPNALYTIDGGWIEGYEARLFQWTIRRASGFRLRKRDEAIAMFGAEHVEFEEERALRRWEEMNDIPTASDAQAVGGAR